MSHCVFHCAWAERERASFSSGLSGFHKLRNPSLAAELSESRAGFRKKGTENYPATGGCFSFSRNCFLSIRGWTHFYPVNKHYSPDDSLLTKKKSPHLLPKISLTSPIFFFSQGRDSDHLPVVSAPLSRARQSEAEIMASPGPRRFARGGEGVAFHLRAILVFHYIRVRILLPLRPCIIFP